jgi:hypothetical protein
MDRNSFRDDLAFSIGFVIQQNRALLRWSIWRWRDSRSTSRSNPGHVVSALDQLDHMAPVSARHVEDLGRGL